jgi:hypothetical protein
MPFLLLILMLCSLSMSVRAMPTFVHCFDFGCKSVIEIEYSKNQWQEIRSLFTGPQNNFQEKQSIRKAIALMENFSGQLSGTHLDKGGNYPGYDLKKQLDCIDESTNTLQYLRALENMEWLRWHRVAPKQRRIVWFISHWTAVIEDIASGHRFAVDSWHRDNGEPPILQPIKDWQKDREFPSDLNPDY